MHASLYLCRYIPTLEGTGILMKKNVLLVKIKKRSFKLQLIEKCYNQLKLNEIICKNTGENHVKIVYKIYTLLPKIKIIR